MHEYSLVRALLSHVRAAVVFSEAPPVANRRLVLSVTVSCGPLSGVEPLLVQQAFEVLKQDASNTVCDFTRAQLAIEEKKLTAECTQCSKEFEVQDFVFRCPICESSSIRVTGGEEFRLLQVEIGDTVENLAPH